MFEDSTETKGRAANELRHIISTLPSLAVYIDEVHHATDSEKKLRSVVTKDGKEKCHRRYRVFRHAVP